MIKRIELLISADSCYFHVLLAFAINESYEINLFVLESKRILSVVYIHIHIDALRWLRDEIKLHDE